MKFAFCTCVQLGLSCIKEIYSIGGQLDLMITLKDEKAKNKSGRIYLDNIANEHNVPLIKINNVNDRKVINALKEYAIDYLFIIGWSQIAKNELLVTPVKGCIGMHPTLLPTGRGRAAIPWAILKGLDKTGVTMFKLDEGIDTGDILGKIEIALSKNETATELYEKVDKAHIELMRTYFPFLADDTVVALEQDETKATYWDGRKSEDGEIKKEMDTAYVDKLVRAVTKPYPGAFFYQNNKKIIVWECQISSKEQGEYFFRLKDGVIIPVKYEVEV